MFISEFLSEANFGLASLTLHVFLTINNNEKTVLQLVMETGRIGLRLSYERISVVHLKPVGKVKSTHVAGIGEKMASNVMTFALKSTDLRERFNKVYTCNLNDLLFSFWNYLTVVLFNYCYALENVLTSCQ